VHRDCRLYKLTSVFLAACLAAPSIPDSDPCLKGIFTLHAPGQTAFVLALLSSCMSACGAG
jgi:hypothetical protein